MLSPSQLDALISLLDDSDWEVKQHVRQKLVGLGAAVIPVLEQKWEGDRDDRTITGLQSGQHLRVGLYPEGYCT